jgi:uncharacterized membrane protein affecting hemolysin expression
MHAGLKLAFIILLLVTRFVSQEKRGRRESGRPERSKNGNSDRVRTDEAENASFGRSRRPRQLSTDASAN